MRDAPARTLAAAGIAGVGAVAAAAAYLIVRGVPGLALRGRDLPRRLRRRRRDRRGPERRRPVVEPRGAPEPAAARRGAALAPQVTHDRGARSSSSQRPLRSSRSIAGTRESRRPALARVRVRRPERGAARAARSRELEAERDGLLQLVAEERERFERTLDELGGGIGRHGNELAELERELEALIAR